MKERIEGCKKVAEGSKKIVSEKWCVELEAQSPQMIWLDEGSCEHTDSLKARERFKIN